MNNFFMMAFAAGQASKEAAAGSFAKYIGVASVKIEAINPTKAELNTIYNTDKFTTEPVYTGAFKNAEGKDVKYANVNVIMRTVPENNNGIETLVQHRFMVTEEYRVNGNKDKLQVIDKYGRTAWVTKEEMAKHAIPVYSSGMQANLDKDYRPVHKGEENLTNFFKAFLNISDPANYKDGAWVMKTEGLDACEARFDNIENLIQKGDDSELKAAWKYQANNKVKILIGIRTYEGKEYMDVFDRYFLKNGMTSLDKLKKEVTDAKNNGAFSNTIFEVSELHEYKVAPTPMADIAAPADDPLNPFGDPATNKFFN